ncbi:MAG: cadherin domain-containing protein [Bacteroidota bacterium]
MKLLGIMLQLMVLLQLTINTNSLAVNCRPEIKIDQQFSVSEDLTKETSIGILEAVACGEDRPLAGWTITIGNELNVFAINAGTGELFVNEVAHLDAEDNNLFKLKITVSDGLTVSDEVEVVIMVEDINDNPSVILADQLFEVSELAVNETVFGTVMYSDADLSEEVQSWSILSGNVSEAFSIDENTGELKVNNTNATDAESMAIFELGIAISDGIHQTIGVVSITILNENDTSPEIEKLQVFEVDEVAENGTVIGEILATDPDGDTQFENWEIHAEGSDDVNEVFGFNEEGQLIVKNNSMLNFEEQPQYKLSVAVSDGINISAPVTVTVFLIDFDREDCDRDGIPNYRDLYSCVSFTVPVVFTPNGDGINDQLIIEGLEAYPDNFVKIINRWGAVVWEDNGYDNNQSVFQGMANKGLSVSGSDGGVLAEGTYFYFLDPRDGRRVQKGFFTIKR